MRLGGERYFTCIVRDITERKTAYDQLRKLSLAVEQSPESILITDREGRIEYVNAGLRPGDRVQPRGTYRQESARPALGQHSARDLRRPVGCAEPRPVVEGRVLQPQERRQRVCRVCHHHAAIPARRVDQPLCGGEGRHHGEETTRYRTGSSSAPSGRARGESNSGTGHGEAGGRRRQPRQVRLSGQHVARAAHPFELDHRFL